jgi:signal transduction histidine kinase
VLRAELHGDEVLVAVSDTGPGIPREEFRNIFEPYHTGSGLEKCGTGLGLYVARAIVERHGGRIWFASELQVGSTFFFSLPRT